MLAVVAVGGFVGTLARYGLGVLVPEHARGWPWSTFAVNCVGAFALCLLLHCLAARGPDEGSRQLVRLGIGTGVLGAFTTYSALAVESVDLLQDGRPGLAAGYAVGTLVCGLACGAVGIAVAERVTAMR